MKEIKGDIYDLDQKSKIQFSNWDAHLGHGFNTQPNTPYDDVWDCVRMRGGMYNDADCDDNTGRVLSTTFALIKCDVCLKFKMLVKNFKLGYKSTIKILMRNQYPNHSIS